MFDRVVGDSEFNVSELEARGYPRGHVIPVFYDDLFFRRPFDDAEAELRSFNGSCINMAFIGRFVPNKRPDNLIRIAALVGKMSGRKTKLRLFGKLWDRTYFRTLWRLVEDLGLEDAVSFELNVPREGLKSALSSSDAFVSASEHEGFMVPLVEAFATGCPVVALASSAVVGTCGSAGLLVTEPDLEQMAARIVCIAENPDLKRSLMRVQAQRSEDFSSLKTLNKWNSLLGEFLPTSLVKHENRV
ncbi:hypothetical protein GCM10007301_45280 [Azorhizobium oxalatiphilum]|uniref:Glycosyl transferase family 1 domain-containing protein n=2 Tax=Azorhizobium oxalatiphilum TaxID=980631 RepID=A0A917FFL4_9HYPH|nr:hypothetical protein GCM10007301_45280 [Azorhizobium oxalatiphilum]